MRLSKDEIRDHVARGLIQGLSVDTSSFERAGYRFETGVLGQLHAIASTKLKFLLPEIIYREVSNHAREKAKLNFQKARQVLRELPPYWPVEPAGFADAMNIVDAEKDDGATLSDQRLQRFLMGVSATILPTRLHANLDEVVDAYFGRRPPFGADKKKSEFPDALALSSLEGWATTNKTMVLAVSNDKDWESFCAGSPNLVMMDDLADAIACCQPRIAMDLAAGLTSEVAKGTMPSLLPELAAALNNQVDKFRVDESFDSVFAGDTEVWITAADVNEPRIQADPITFDPLSYKDGLLIVRAVVPCLFEISGTITFSVRDSIDKDYVPLGSTEVEVNIEENVEAVISISVQAYEPWVVTEVEFEPARVSADFGHVKPDWMDRPDTEQDD